MSVDDGDAWVEKKPEGGKSYAFRDIVTNGMWYEKNGALMLQRQATLDEFL